MEKALRTNDHKGGWGNCPKAYLLGRLVEEVQELRAIIDIGTGEEIIKESADVANFAMMIADIARKQ